MRRKKRSSLIPEKAQVPVAVVGAVVLAIILVYRFFPAGASAPAAASVGIPPETLHLLPPDALLPNETGDYTDGGVRELGVLVAQLRQFLVEAPPAEAAPPRLNANPFSPLALGVPPEEMLDPLADSSGIEVLGQDADGPAAYGVFAAAPSAPLPEGPSFEERERTARLESLRLTATASAGPWAMAVINGAHYRPGETVEGFTITHIGEKRVGLQDALGSAVLELYTRTGSGAPPRTVELSRTAPQAAPPAADIEGMPATGDESL